LESKSSDLATSSHLDQSRPKLGSPYQPMEVLIAVVYDASLIHPTATTATATAVVADS